MARMPNVNRIRLRRSGTLNILRTAARNFSILSVAQTSVCDFTMRQHRLKSVPLRADYCYGTAGFLNLLARAPGKAVRRNFHCLGHFAVAEHDDVMLGLLDDPAIMHEFGSHFVVFGECF